MMKSMGDHKGFSLILFVKRKDSGSSGWIVWVNVWLHDWYCRQVFSFYYNRIISEQSGMHMMKWCKRIFANTLANLARRTLNCVHWEEGAIGKSWGGQHTGRDSHLPCEKSMAGGQSQVLVHKRTKHGKQKRRIKGLCSYDLSGITEKWWDNLCGWSAVMEACRSLERLGRWGGDAF